MDSHEPAGPAGGGDIDGTVNTAGFQRVALIAELPKGSKAPTPNAAGGDKKPAKQN